ncbi:MAG: hypothetical protein LBE09_06700 [Christensenellaceae bacterium]|jgi:hypothetical protein|nr:hypothetical protein [Christensenellaceae bacterium]
MLKVGKSFHLNTVLIILMIIGLILTILIFGSALSVASVTVAQAADLSLIDTPYKYTKAELDAYTDSDLLYNPNPGQANLTIRQYKSQLHTQGLSAYIEKSICYATVTQDDPIVKIVPRKFFEHRGTYLHIGQEYGIFTKTELLNESANISVVFVFDITRYPLNNSNYPSQYIIEINPLFQYSYYYLTENNAYFTKNYELQYNVSSDLSTVVVAKHTRYIDSNPGEMPCEFGETKTFFLKDISFGLSLYNEQELNIGDSGYSKYSDNGSFITRINLNYSGVSNQSLINNSVLSTIELGLGWLPKVGNFISIPGYLTDLQKNFSDNFRESSEYGNLYSAEYYNSKLEQVIRYPNLNKVGVAQLLSDDSKPLLFGRSKEGNYVRGAFTLGMTLNWYTRVIDTIQLSVVSESTNLITDKSTITHRSIAEVSKTTNIRNMQTKGVSLETSKTFYMLPEGIAKLSFNAKYASKYNITLSNSSKMIVRINGTEITFSSNVASVALSPGDSIIDIIGTNTSKLSATINVAPDTLTASTGNKPIEIGKNQSYLLKINSLSQIKKLSTGNTSIVIDQICTNKSWTPYTTYGSISPSSTLTHPFTSGNYYVILKNTSGSKGATFSIKEPDTISVDTPKSISVNSLNYTYIKFTTDTTGGQYIITPSNHTGLTFNILSSTTLSDAGGRHFPECFYEIGLDPNNSYYIGVKNTGGSANNLTIKKVTGSLYKWKITGGEIGTITTTAENYQLTRGYTYTLTLVANNEELINGEKIGNSRFSYTNQNTAFGKYNISWPSNNKITIQANSPLLGNGIIVQSYIVISNKQLVMIDELMIIPKFEGKAKITAINNNEDLSFNYSVPKYVFKFDYRISPYINEFSVNIGINKAKSADTVTGNISFLENLNALNCTTAQTLRIDITRIYYLDAVQNIKSVEKIISSGCSVNSLFGSGNGGLFSPYEIRTIRHLNNIKHYKGELGKGKIFILAQSITFPVKEPNDDNPNSHELHTITFCGIFYGNLKYIRNIRYYIKKDPQGTDIGGLFGINEGIIVNLNLESLKINSAISDHNTETSISVGGVVGTNRGLLYYVRSYSSNLIINRMNAHTGGIAGYNMQVSDVSVVREDDIQYNIVNCYVQNAGKIYSNGYVGGIVGVNNGNLYQCSIDCAMRVELYQINANNRPAGGIVGYNNYGIITICINYATVAFVNPSTENNKNITPMLGQIAGLNYYNTDNLIAYELGGKIEAGSLRTKSKKDRYQQLYVGAHSGGAMGRSIRT